MIKKIAAACFVFILLTGCITPETPEERAARIEAQQRAHATYLAENVCNADAAYAAGINAGKEFGAMKSNFAGECAENHDTYNERYAEGYRFGLKNAKQPPTQITNTQEVFTGGTSADRTHKQHHADNYICLKDKWHGNKVCGYDCIESAFDGIVCAKHATGNCIEEFGHVTCGTNCRKEFAHIECDEKDVKHS